MRSFKLVGFICLCATYIHPCDPDIKKWSALQATLENQIKLETALKKDQLPTDEASLMIIGDFIAKQAPKSQTGSPCCVKKNVEIDQTLEDLMRFHNKQVASLRQRRNSLSKDQRDSLEIIEKDIRRLPKKIRKSYGSLPTADQ